MYRLQIEDQKIRLIHRVYVRNDLELPMAVSLYTSLRINVVHRFEWIRTANLLCWTRRGTWRGLKRRAVVDLSMIDVRWGALEAFAITTMPSSIIKFPMVLSKWMAIYQKTVCDTVRSWSVHAALPLQLRTSKWYHTNHLIPVFHFCSLRHFALEHQDPQFRSSIS